MERGREGRNMNANKRGKEGTIEGGKQRGMAIKSRRRRAKKEKEPKKSQITSQQILSPKAL